MPTSPISIKNSTEESQFTGNGDTTQQVRERSQWGTYRVVVFGVPGTPIFEIGEDIANGLDSEMFSLDRVDEDYFIDNIPETRMDTGDSWYGSESQHGMRDPLGEARQRAIDRFLKIETGPVAPLTAEERNEIMNIPSGVFVTEMADPVMIQWIKEGDGLAVFLEANEERAVCWLKRRRKCPSCATAYHLDENPPLNLLDGICDRCGTELIIREEDKARNVRHQMAIWRAEFKHFNNLISKVNLGIVDMGGCEDYDELLLKVQSLIRERLFKR